VPTRKNFLKHALEQAFHPTVKIKKLGQVQLKCKCGSSFQLDTVNIEVLKHKGLEIACPACQRAVIRAKLTTCQKCGGPLGKGDEFYCARCVRETHAYHGVYAK
jgi:hypothetical protein